MLIKGSFIQVLILSIHDKRAWQKYMLLMQICAFCISDLLGGRGSAFVQRPSFEVLQKASYLCLLLQDEWTNDCQCCLLKLRLVKLKFVRRRPQISILPLLWLSLSLQLVVLSSSLETLPQHLLFRHSLFSFFRIRNRRTALFYLTQQHLLPLGLVEAKGYTQALAKPLTAFLPSAMTSFSKELLYLTSSSNRYGFNDTENYNKDLDCSLSFSFHCEPCLAL